MKKQDFFENIRNKFGQRNEENQLQSYELGVPEYYRQTSLNQQEKIELFIKNVEEVSGKAYVVNSKRELENRIREIIDQLQAKTIIHWDHPLLEQVDIDWIDLNSDIYLWGSLKSKEENIAIAKEASIGITAVDAAIANTGTIVLLADGKKGRAVSLLPPVHIAIITANQLVTRMGEVFEKFRETDCSSINFITGPSKSADIELTLTVGVHGPKYFYAMIIEELI